MGNETGRGSGKTYRQIRAVPDGGIFIVHDRGMAGHCRAILQAQGRMATALKFVGARTVERVPDQLFGASHIGCDHNVELTPKLAKALQIVGPTAYVNFPAYVPEPQPGDPLVALGKPLIPGTSSLDGGRPEPRVVALLRRCAAHLRVHETASRMLAYIAGFRDPNSTDPDTAVAECDADLAAEIEAFLAERERLMEKPAPFDGPRMEI